MAVSPTTTVTNPRIAKLIELEVSGRIKPEHQTELDTYRAQGYAPKKAVATSTENERTAAFLGSGVGTSLIELEEIGKRNPAALKPYLSTRAMGGDKSLLGEWNNGPDRRQAVGAQDILLDSALTLGTGQAYNKEQFENYKSAYLPGSFDDDATIAAKARRMRSLLERAKIKSGGSAADIDKAMAAFGFGGSQESPAVGGKQVDGLATGIGDAVDRKIDEVAGIAPAGLRVNVDGTPPQSPEFRAGLTALLNDPSTTRDQVLSYWEKNAPGALRAGADPKVAAPLAVERGPNGLAENADAFVRGAADTATLGFADEIAAAGDTIFGDGTMAENLRRERGVDRYDQGQNYIARGLGQLAGAIAPVGVGILGNRIRGARHTAILGGGLGAAYGVGSGETLADRFRGGVAGGAAGAAGGAVFGKLSDLIGARLGRSATGGRAQEAYDMLEASNDLQVPILPADAGGPTTRLLTAAAAATPGGVQPITSAARMAQMRGGAALDRMAGREGVILDNEAAGEAARAGALHYRSSSRDAIGREYAKAADLAGETRVDPKTALANLDQHIAELSEIPGGADGLSALQTLRDDIAKRGTVTVDGIRGMRTQLRQRFMKDGLVGSDIERRVNQAVDAASDDLAASLQAEGKGEAANLYREADNAWKERAKTLDDVILPIIGKKNEKSGEQIVAGLNAAAKGNNARLDKFFNALPQEEAGPVRATLINNLGKARAGAQNAAGNDFSFDTFLTNWNTIGQSAKNTLFRGENRKAIDQLALLAEKSKAAGRFRNTSNTGLTLTSGATAATAVSSFLTLGKVLAAQYGAGRVLASPHVAKALLNIAKATTPEALQTRIGALSSVAVKDPSVRNEVLSLQQRLFNAVNDNASTGGRVAAEEKDGQENR